MPRSKEQNQQIRETKKEKILDIALNQYVMYGYNGTDMDTIAEKANVAKGLLYYYFKTKNVLFRELFNKMIVKTTSFSNEFFMLTQGLKPVEKLIKYSLEIFNMGIGDPRLIQFAMRMPFDAYSVFGPEGWEEGLKGATEHIENLSGIISEGIRDGSMKCIDPYSGANSFWTVYVASLFSFIKMSGSEANEVTLSDYDEIEKLLEFGMNGLKVSDDLWKSILLEYKKERKNESI